MLILIDTGILLRLIERNDPQNEIIRCAMRILVARGDELATATQNIAEFWNVCTRPDTSRGGYVLDIPETDRRAKVLERVFRILADQPPSYRLWRQLIVAYSVKGKQVHDARLVALMETHGITHILSLNCSDFDRFSGITPIDPANLVALEPPSASA